jgi:hypothetical protein
MSRFPEERERPVLANVCPQIGVINRIVPAEGFIRECESRLVSGAASDEAFYTAYLIAREWTLEEDENVCAGTHQQAIGFVGGGAILVGDLRVKARSSDASEKIR